MFNVCILTGPVLTEPKLSFFEGHPDTIFYLGISIGPYRRESSKLPAAITWHR